MRRGVFFEEGSGLRGEGVGEDWAGRYADRRGRGVFFQKQVMKITAGGGDDFFFFGIVMKRGFGAHFLGE